jgi:5-enolpyruvylshikimate-3-phosphate synthase
MVSEPFIEMTIKIMKELKVNVIREKQTFTISKQNYNF